MLVEITLTDEERERWTPLGHIPGSEGIGALADLIVIDGRVVKVKAAGTNLGEAQAAWDARKAEG